MTHDVQNQMDNDCCKPDCPPPSTQDEPCTGTLSGAITGTVTMDCCCPRLYSRTFILNPPPQTIAQLQTYLQNTVSAYENSGYIVLAHSVTDAGGGWVVGLTVAWYAP